jgi:integrase
MPRLTKSLPQYRRHKASGQAIVTLNGRDFYLGPWKSKASRIEYDRRISEWTASGRGASLANEASTVHELLDGYWTFAEQHYRKNGEQTNELANIRHALRPLKRLYGHTLVGSFGPLALKALQCQMVQDGLSRGVVNQRIGIIKRVFRWAVSEQIAPPSLCHALSTVMGLQRGRTEARDTAPIKAVGDPTIKLTLPLLPPVVADMVRFQRLTGCRPSEVCTIRPADVIRGGDVWKYRPESHKTEHHGKERFIFIGPKAQAVLLPYLLRESDAYCFSPIESETARKAELRAKRKTRVQPSQRDRSKTRAKRRPKDRYTRMSYLWAVRRACERAFPVPEGLSEAALKTWRKANWWSPNQLRHSAATEIRKLYGIEGSQVVLGHAKADTTQIYAERDHDKAAEIMRQVG